MAENCRRCKAPLPEGAKFCPACGTKQEIAKIRRQRGNGTGTAYKRGKTWTAVYIPAWKDKTHPVKRTKGGFPTKRAALDYIPVLRGGKPKKAVTLASLYASWSETKMLKLNETNQRTYRKAFERIADIAYQDITALTIDDLQRVASAQGKTYYTCRAIKNLLMHLYKRAIAEQVITTDLPQFIELPELDEKAGEAFSPDELRALWKDYERGHTFTGYVLLMIYTGMMPGELMICEKSMIDWEKQEILGCGLKTSIRRKTPMVFPDFIEPVLRDLCADNPEDKRLMCLTRPRFYEEFRAMLERRQCREELTAYSCRHTTATALSLGNIAPAIIQRTMRHSKYTTTQGYIHMGTEQVKDALNSLRARATVNIPTT